MGFEAELTNPRPVGTIHTKGSFGPWMVEDPGESPLTGDYRFDHADLSGFKGIAGILSSTGHYQGTLREHCCGWGDGYAGFPADVTLARRCHCTRTFTRGWTGPTGTRGWNRWRRRWGSSHFWAQGKIVRVAPAADGEGGPRRRRARYCADGECGSGDGLRIFCGSRARREHRC